MINLRRAAAVAATALGLALGTLAAPASAAGTTAAVSAASTTHVTFSVGDRTGAASTMPLKAGSSPNATIVGAGNTVQGPDGWCTYTSWGGKYFCGSQSWYQISGQLFQVFVIGRDNAVWTRWSNTSGVSGWVSLGGICAQADFSTQEFVVSSAWNFGTECFSPIDGNYYVRIRSAVNGSWSTWSNIGGTPIIP